jgi:hypothetical protein
MNLARAAGGDERSAACFEHAECLLVKELKYFTYWQVGMDRSRLKKKKKSFRFESSAPNILRLVYQLLSSNLPTLRHENIVNRIDHWLKWLVIIYFIAVRGILWNVINHVCISVMDENKFSVLSDIYQSNFFVAHNLLYILYTI